MASLKPADSLEEVQMLRLINHTVTPIFLGILVESAALLVLVRQCRVLKYLILILQVF